MNGCGFGLMARNVKQKGLLIFKIKEEHFEIILFKIDGYSKLIYFCCKATLAFCFELF